MCASEARRTAVVVDDTLLTQSVPSVPVPRSRYAENVVPIAHFCSESSRPLRCLDRMLLHSRSTTMGVACGLVAFSVL